MTTRPERRPAAIALRGVTAALGCRISAVAELVLLAWLLGRLLSDRYEWSQYLLWIPTPLALLASLLGTLASWRPDDDRHARRRRRVGWTALLVALAGWFTIVEHRLLRAPGAPVDGALTVAHWDLGGIVDGHERDLSTIVAQFDADVIVLTSGDYRWDSSVTRDAAEGHGFSLAFAGQARTDLPVRVLVRNSLDFDLQSLFSVRLGSARVHRLQVRRPPLDAWTIIDIAELRSDPRAGRKHVADGIRHEYETRSPSPPDVVIGDINITRGSAALRRAFPDMHHAYDDGGGRYAASFHRGLPLYHIDHILLGAGLRAARYELIDPGGGRHLGQRAWIVPDP